jgi:lysozyme
METISEMLTRHEGRRYKRYKDSVGIWTIGVGHNLEAKGRMGIIPLDRDLEAEGITDAEIDALLQQDISDTMADIRGKITFFDALDEARQNVLIDMCFNMGIGSTIAGTGLLGFPKMLSCLAHGDYEGAADQLKDSKYYTQVGQRAVENYNLLKGVQ